ncbi:unnamed protein product [Nesidiocoris tenuis]|uniref:Uncharacterized protein n=1 Tax=Nesidiocoris tenuis TaxID=355587 RepID=A0A6H5HS12_9HEMI|nr:unnamed protein product [Nesidiocoris tenuis]
MKSPCEASHIRRRTDQRTARVPSHVQGDPPHAGRRTCDAQRPVGVNPRAVTKSSKISRIRFEIRAFEYAEALCVIRAFIEQYSRSPVEPSARDPLRDPHPCLKNRSRVTPVSFRYSSRAELGPGPLWTNVSYSGEMAPERGQIIDETGVAPQPTRNQVPTRLPPPQSINLRTSVVSTNGAAMASLKQESPTSDYAEDCPSELGESTCSSVASSSPVPPMSIPPPTSHSTPITSLNSSSTKNKHPHHIPYDPKVSSSNRVGVVGVGRIARIRSFPSVEEYHKRHRMSIQQTPHSNGVIRIKQEDDMPLMTPSEDHTYSTMESGIEHSADEAFADGSDSNSRRRCLFQLLVTDIRRPGRRGAKEDCRRCGRIAQPGRHQDLSNALGSGCPASSGQTHTHLVADVADQQQQLDAQPSQQTAQETGLSAEDQGEKVGATVDGGRPPSPGHQQQL